MRFTVTSRLWAWIALPMAISCLFLGLSLMRSIESSRRDGEYWSKQVSTEEEVIAALRLIASVSTRSDDAALREAFVKYGRAADAIANEWEHRSDRVASLLQRGHDYKNRVMAMRRETTTDGFTRQRDAVSAAGSELARDWGRLHADHGTALALALSGPLEKWRDAALLCILACVNSFLLVILQRTYRRELDTRKQAEAMTAASEARFRRLFDHVQAGVFETGLDGRLEAANPEFWNLTGHTAESLEKLGAVAALYVDPERRDELMGLLRRKGSFHGQEVRLRRGDGEIITVLISARLRKENGAETSIEGSMHDITARKKSEQESAEQALRLREVHQRLEEQARQLVEQSLEIAAARDQALRSARLRSSFLGNLAREMESPLHGIRELSLTLLAAPLAPGDHLTADRLLKSTEALQAVLAEIREYTRVLDDDLELSDEPFSIRAVLEDVVEQVAEEAHTKELALPCWVRPGTPDLLAGDPKRLRQILLSLVDNAVRYTSSGEVAARITKAFESGDQVQLRIEVEDTGPGIEPREAEMLFEPFSQVRRVDSSRPRPVGLSLAIARRLVERMGGQIGVDTEPGQGSLFWVVLPFRLQPGAGSRRGSMVTRAAGKRILVADGLASTRGMIADLVGGWQARVTTAATADQALTLARTGAEHNDPFDLVLVEEPLPGMSGIAVAQTLLEDPLTARAPVILVVPYPYRRWGNEPVLPGRHQLLVWPVTESGLSAAVEECLPAAPSRVQGPPQHRPPPAGTKAGRVLVVEDNLVNQKVTRRLVEKLGFTAEIAGTGAQAVDKVMHDGPYAAVLMDWQMPDMDGLGATAAIRALAGEASRTPVIAMTAKAMTGDREQCLAAGMNGYLSKPTSLDALREALDRWAVHGRDPVRGMQPQANAPQAIQ